MLAHTLHYLSRQADSDLAVHESYAASVNGDRSTRKA